MKLLFNAQDFLGRVPEGTKEDMTELKELLLEEFEGVDARISFGEFTFGVADPDTIKTGAGSWNQKILSQLMEKINSVMADPAAFTLDSDASFHLFEAARLADDRFSLWGDAGLIFGNEGLGVCYKTVIPENILEGIQENPEEWAAVDLTAY